MAQFPVVCPQCGHQFTVSPTRKKGTCAQCSSSLLFEKIPCDMPRKETGKQEPEIDVSALEDKIDGAIKDKSVDPHIPQVQDIAVISGLASPNNYSQVTLSVNKLLQTKG
jgi:hypothetical protein